MQIKLTPNLRCAWEMAVMADKYEARLIELFGTVADAKASHDEWKINKPPIHHWTTYNTIAFMEATSELTPSEKKMMVAEVRFE